MITEVKMEQNEKKKEKVEEGYQPNQRKKGYQPSTGDLDTANPPQGGSGVPEKPQTDKDKQSNKK